MMLQDVQHHDLMMQSVVPTLFLCLGYVYIATVWGPRYMKDRPPFEIRDNDIITILVTF